MIKALLRKLNIIKPATGGIVDNKNVKRDLQSPALFISKEDYLRYYLKEVNEGEGGL